MKYIDTHSHYLHRQFNNDRNALIDKLLQDDVQYIIECGTNTWSNARVLGLCEQYENMYATIGYFPCDTAELESGENFELLKSQLMHEKVVGVGEIGLDYYHEGNPAQQRKWFIEQLKLAKSIGLPVCIHSRNAEKDTVEILKNNGSMTGVIHCYAYGVKTMRELVKLGYAFGVGGTCTYKNNVELRDAIREMPLDRIVLETDCPYLTPDAMRRKRNDSSNIKYVIDEISKLKKVSPEEVIRVTNENVKRIYSKMK